MSGVLNLYVINATMRDDLARLLYFSTNAVALESMSETN